MSNIETVDRPTVMALSAVIESIEACAALNRHELMYDV